MKTVVLIDTSYMAFHRFFATLRWYQFANKEDYKLTQDIENYDWIENKTFMEKYKKMFLESIEKVLKKKIIENSILVFCCDSQRGTLWRKKLYNDYKEGRVDLSIKNNFRSVFKYTFRKLIPKIIKKAKYPSYMFKLNKIEADDLIAIISKELIKKNKDVDIIIISSDDDFTQLLNKNIKIIDFKKKVFNQKIEKESKLLLYKKILLGDCSDNIPSVLPKDRKILSLKRRKIILDDCNELNLFLDENPQYSKQYEINKKLIDFNYMPNSIIKKITDKIPIKELLIS
jgi:5'-3' exonuclease